MSLARVLNIGALRPDAPGSFFTDEVFHCSPLHYQNIDFVVLRHRRRVFGCKVFQSEEKELAFSPEYEDWRHCNTISVLISNTEWKKVDVTYPNIIGLCLLLIQFTTFRRNLFEVCVSNKTQHVHMLTKYLQFEFLSKWDEHLFIYWSLWWFSL